MNIQELNEQLNYGILPENLNFSLQKDYTIDLNKIKYNAFYRSYEFYESKFPKGYESIAGFDKIIEHIAIQNESKTPLDEIEERSARPE